MRKLRILLTTLLVLSMIVSLVGCGAKKEDVKTGNSTTDTKATETKANDSKANDAASKDEEITLKFTYWGSPDEKTAIEAACAAFTALHPSIKVEAVQIPNADYNAKLTAMAASNDSPDAGYMTADLGETWSKEGKFVNIFEKLDQDPNMSKEDYLDYIWFNVSPDNAWGIATAGECFGLYYNKDALSAAGIAALPTTAEKALS